MQSNGRRSFGRGRGCLPSIQQTAAPGCPTPLEANQQVGGSGEAQIVQQTTAKDTESSGVAAASAEQIPTTPDCLTTGSVDVEKKSSEQMWGEFDAMIEKSKNWQDSKKPEGPPPTDQPETEFDKPTASLINKKLRSTVEHVAEDHLEVYPMDQQAPLYTVKTFNELQLPTELSDRIIKMGFRSPSTIQEKALPLLLKNPPENMIAQSHNGTGKTATFLIATLMRIDVTQSNCQAIVMAPTRELARQIYNVAEQMAQNSRIRLIEAIPGEPVQCGHVIIGTPGTLHNWVVNNRGGGAAASNSNWGGGGGLDFSRVCVFVLDEADILMEEKSFSKIAHEIKRALPTACQLLLFSATFTELVINFAKEFLENANEIRVRKEHLSLANIQQYCMRTHAGFPDKFAGLCNLIGHFGMHQCIIFCKTRREANQLRASMNSAGHAVCVLHSELSIANRDMAIQQFREHLSHVLITTNVCSRGIDIPLVNLIVNWDMPLLVANANASGDATAAAGGPGAVDMETYLHRVGRTGRFGKRGISVNFLSGSQDELRQKAIEEYFQIKIKHLDFQDTSTWPDVDI